MGIAPHIQRRGCETFYASHRTGDSCRDAAFGGRMRPPFSLRKKMRRARWKRNVFLFCLGVPASSGRYRSSAQSKSRLRLTNRVPAFYRKCLREVQRCPNCDAAAAAARAQRVIAERNTGQYSDGGAVVQRCRQLYPAQDCAALRSGPLIFCHTDAGNTPVLRTEGFHIPKFRQTSFLPPCTAHSFGCFQKNGGCIPGGCYPPLQQDMFFKQTKGIFHNGNGKVILR